MNLAFFYFLDILKASKGKKEKDFGYIPFNEKLPEILEKLEKKQ